MCNYCGCRAIEPIAQLTAEHERILNLSGEIRRAVTGGADVTAAELLRTLQELLAVHDAVEELSLYPAMARLLEFEDMVGTLFDEHDEFDRVVQAALTAADGTGPDTADWAGVLTVLETLSEHIDHEEHGVFPAAAVNLDPADWEHAAAVRVQQTARHEQPNGANERAADVASLRRWADNGGVWRVVSRAAARVEVSLLTCDGGQEMDRLTSGDPAVLDFIGVRSGSDEPQHL